MIGYKMDVLDALRSKGFTSYALRKNKLLGESTLTKLRTGKLLSWHELDTVCRLLDMQPGDVVEYVQEDSEPS